MPEISLDEAAEIRDRALAPWVAKLDLRIEHVGADGMRLRLPYHADLVQGGGAICGQAMMAAADAAMVLGVANALGGLEPITTVSQNTNFLRPALGATDIVLEVSIMKTGRQLVVGEVTLYAGGSDRAIAHVTSTYARAAREAVSAPRRSPTYRGPIFLTLSSDGGRPSPSLRWATPACRRAATSTPAAPGARAASAALPGARECNLVEALRALAEVSVPVPGFGSSDCRSCPAHLLAAPADLDVAKTIGAALTLPSP